MLVLKIIQENKRASINEMYFAFQGEGQMIGTPCIFVRTHGCPVHCKWCDTPYTWDGSEKGDRSTADDVIARATEMAESYKCSHIVLTGGEPMIQRGLFRMLDRWVKNGFTVEVETAAIFPPVEGIHIDGVRWNLSPKMPSAEPKRVPDPLVINQWLTENNDATLKIVISDEIDWQSFLSLWSGLSEDIDPRRVFLMPCGISRVQIQDSLKWLMDKAEGWPFRITPRMQITAYGDKRGV